MICSAGGSSYGRRSPPQSLSPWAAPQVASRHMWECQGVILMATEAVFQLMCPDVPCGLACSLPRSQGAHSRCSSAGPKATPFPTTFAAAGSLLGCLPALPELILLPGSASITALPILSQAGVTQHRQDCRICRIQGLNLPWLLKSCSRSPAPFPTLPAVLHSELCTEDDHNPLCEERDCHLQKACPNLGFFCKLLPFQKFQQWLLLM